MPTNNPNNIQQVQQPIIYQQMAPAVNVQQAAAPKKRLKKPLNWSTPPIGGRGADVETVAKELIQNIRENLSNLRHLHKALMNAKNAELPYQKEYLNKTEEYNTLLNDINEFDRGELTQQTVTELKIIVDQLTFDRVRIDSIFPEITDKAMQMEEQMAEMLDKIRFDSFHDQAEVELNQIKASEQKMILEDKKGDEEDNTKFSISSAVYMISIFNEMKASEKQIIALKIQNNQLAQRTKNSFLIGMTTTLISFAILLFSLYYFEIDWKDIKDYSILGIPLGVGIWSFIGSFAAMLTQFNKEPIHKFGDPLKWVIIRPALGVVMGAAIYLALFSLILTGKNQNALLPLLVAFFVGYSDTFTFNIMASIQKVLSNLFNSADNNSIKNNVQPVYMVAPTAQPATTVLPTQAATTVMATTQAAATIVTTQDEHYNELVNNAAPPHTEEPDPLKDLKNTAEKDPNAGEEE
ncbi:MAG: hypothetical protein JKY03_11935 [Aureispira sp.]|nr:hypothetical protein [Aureispira sp.]